MNKKYLNDIMTEYFEQPAHVDIVIVIEVHDADGELLGILEDNGNKYQIRVNGEYRGEIKKTFM